MGWLRPGVGHVCWRSTATFTRFLENILDWLLTDDPAGPEPLRLMLAQPMRWPGLSLTVGGVELGCVGDSGPRKEGIATVERVLRKTGVIKALARPQWEP